MKVFLILFLFQFPQFVFCKTPDAGPNKQILSDLQLRSEIRNTIGQVQNQLLDKRVDNTYWNFPLYLGPMYTSQYILLRHWLEQSPHKNNNNTNNKHYPVLSQSRFNAEVFKKYLFKIQNTDGSWPVILDYNTFVGDINATIMHYAALRVLGLEDSDPVLARARAYILKKGGIANTNLFTKIVLGLFGNFPWSDIPNIPYFIFNDNFPVNYKDFGQWVTPHLYPIAYLHRVKAHLRLQNEFNLDALWLNSPPTNLSNIPALPPTKEDRKLLLKMLANQKTNGSFGGYTTATLFTLISARHYQQFYSDLDDKIETALGKGLNFVDRLYFDSGDSSYLGVTCDGRYWDTALIGQGLIESGINPMHLKETSAYLLGIQDTESGGFGFGLDFEKFMDTDDTAEILLYLKKAGIKNAQTEQAIQWLFSMQNKDGGWGAFDRNNNGNFILRFATRDFLDSADMFDESSADVTGHILEALAAYGYTLANSPEVKKAVRYLAETQESQFPAWLGRWGNNYIYGTSASLIGLIKAGVNPRSELIQNSVDWLTQCQNQADGGFGESFNSYNSPHFACKGLSTPTQTAWALMALIETNNGNTLTAQRAAKYLLQSYKYQGNLWTDKNIIVGTGHPKIVSMQYPSYAWAFSLMALSRY